MRERRLTAAWVRYQDGCDLIGLLVICTIPFRFLCPVRIQLCFLFPSFSELRLHNSYLGFRVYPSGLHNNALGLRESLSRLGLHNNALGLRELRHDLVCITMPLVCVSFCHVLVCITMPLVLREFRHDLVCITMPLVCVSFCHVLVCITMPLV